VTGILQRRRFKVWLGSTSAAFACWLGLPGTGLDRAAFTAVCRGFSNPPFLVSGNGSHANPWKLRTPAPDARIDSRHAPAVVSLGDDPEAVFQSSPPSPVDLAVIFSNFQRLGVKNAASAAVLAWDAPDVIGLAALDKSLGRFDSIIMAAPLSRGAMPDAMPLAFRRASVPLAGVRGRVESLPAVNRIPIPGIILGGENALAGFQVIESEAPTELAPLIARWEDRIVFSFPLLVAMQRLRLPLDGMEIRPGEYLRLSPQGPVVPLDQFGRLAVKPRPSLASATIPAEALIVGDGETLPKGAPEPLVLRDDRSGAEPATREFSAMLPALVAAIASDAGMAPDLSFKRPGPALELALLALLSLVLAAVGGRPGFGRGVGFLATAGICLSAQFIAAGISALWLPGLPALAAIGCAAALSRTPPQATAGRVTAPPAEAPRNETPQAPATPAAKDSARPAAKTPRKRGKKRRK